MASISGAGLLFALANTAVGALQPVVMRWSALRLDPLLYSAAATAVAAVCVTIALAITGELRHLAEPRSLARMVAVSLSGTVITTLLVVYGLRHVSAISAVLLVQTEPIYSLALATILLGERPSIRQLIATATIIGGIVWVLAGGGAISFGVGAGLLLITPLFWQISHVLSLRLMPPLSPLVITGARYVYAAVVLGALFLVAGASGHQNLDGRAIMVICVTGVLVYFLGSLSWYGAISRLSLTWTTALVVPGVPLLSVVFAVAFLGEQVSRRQITGIAIATIGVLALVFGADSTRQHAPTAESVSIAAAHAHN